MKLFNATLNNMESSCLIDLKFTTNACRHDEHLCKISLQQTKCKKGYFVTVFEEALQPIFSKLIVAKLHCSKSFCSVFLKFLGRMPVCMENTQVNFHCEKQLQKRLPHFAQVIAPC